MGLTYFGEELVVEDLIQQEAIGGVFLQNGRDEFLSGRGERGGEVVPDFFYTLVSLFKVQGLKRRVSTHQCVPVEHKPTEDIS